MNYYLDVLKKYAVFEGRARRKEYWMFFLWNCIVGILLSIVLAIASGLAGNQAPSSLIWIYFLAVIIPGLAVAVRRLHDTNRSGWWLLISLIPLVGSIILIVFLATDSKPGDNQYGPNPKGAAAATG